jgi:arabinan endo-1,5-alpha-L-arabinosidase
MRGRTKLTLRRVGYLATAAAGLLAVTAMAFQEPPPAPAENAVRHVHDPTIVKEGETYYVFSTGHGIPIRHSRDLVRWEHVGRVFAEDLPQWAREEIPGSVFPWAPDVEHFNGRFHLYYSVSTFGRNRSLMGLVTNKTLDPKSPDYAWKDEGKVFESARTDNYNAIDPNVLQVAEDRLLFLFGSFWSGLKLLEADPKTGKPRPGAEVRSVAARPGSTALEAPFLMRRGEFYYLFVSFDLCCRGVRSTYNIRVGRSKSPDGPFEDREGKPLLEGGGTPVLATEGRVIGPGHCDVLRDGDRYLLVHHFYDGEARGIPTLQVRPLTWDDEGWPKPGSPLGEPPAPGAATPRQDGAPTP